MLPSVLILAPCYVASYGPARDSVGNFMAEYAETGSRIRIKSGWRSSNSTTNYVGKISIRYVPRFAPCKRSETCA